MIYVSAHEYFYSCACININGHVGIHVISIIMINNNMDIIETSFSAIIALLFVSFVYTLVNKLSGYNDNLKMRSKELKIIEFKRHIMLLAIAIFGIICSNFTQTQSTKLGIGYGSIIILIMSFVTYRHNYSNFTKLLICCALFLVVVVLSVNLYNFESVTNISITDHGTK